MVTALDLDAPQPPARSGMSLWISARRDGHCSASQLYSGVARAGLAGCQWAPGNQRAAESSAG
eukprot:15479687-Alexandrium_andersonii.AAC.1